MTAGIQVQRTSQVRCTWLSAVVVREELGRCLVEEGAGQDPRFWNLAQALSALYSAHSDEKRWVDGVLGRKKGLGFWRDPRSSLGLEGLNLSWQPALRRFGVPASWKRCSATKPHGRQERQPQPAVWVTEPRR